MSNQYLGKQDPEFEHRVRTALDSSVTSLDADTRSRLAAGRILAFKRKSWLARRMLPSGIWMPATAFAAIAVLTVTLLTANRHPDTPVQLAQTDADFTLELLLGSDGEDEEDEENGQVTDGSPDFFIQMEAMMLHEEDEQNAG
jgi:hypothetical protein